LLSPEQKIVLQYIDKFNHQLVRTFQ